MPKLSAGGASVPNPAPGSGGGSIAIRGFLAQTLVALLEVVQSGHAFESLTLEPVQGNDQFDFVWTDGQRTHAVQVKTSQNSIGLAQARKWAGQLRQQRDQEDCVLVLVGRLSDELAKLDEIEGVALQSHELDLDAFVERAAHRLARFLEGEQLPPGTADGREQLVHAITSKLQHFATRSAPLSRVVFRGLLRDWVLDCVQPQPAAAPETAGTAVFGSTSPRPVASMPSKTSAVAPTDQPVASVLFIVDLADYTTQTRELGPTATKAFEKTFFPALNRLAAEHGLTKIRTFGDAALFYGSPDDARPFELFERLAGGPGLGLTDTPFRIALRCVVHYGPCAIERGKNGVVTGVFGEDVVVPFRLEKHAQHGQILITSDAWKYLSPTVRSSRAKPETRLVEVPKGFGPKDELLKVVARAAGVNLSKVKASQRWEVRIVALAGAGSASAKAKPEPRRNDGSVAERKAPPTPPNVPATGKSTKAAAVKKGKPASKPKVALDPATLLKNTVSELEKILRDHPAVRELLEKLSPTFVSGGKILDAFVRREIEIVLVLDSLFDAVNQRRVSGTDADALRKVVGGILVFGVDPEWLVASVESVRKQSLVAPISNPSIPLPNGYANILEIVASALADGPAQLERVFRRLPDDKDGAAQLERVYEKIPYDKYDAGSFALVPRGTEEPDIVGELKKHFIRRVLPKGTEAATPKQIEAAWPVVVREIKHSLEKEHIAYKATCVTFLPYVNTIRKELAYHHPKHKTVTPFDIFLLFPSGFDTGDQNEVYPEHVDVLFLAFKILEKLSA